jgi:hypothetical protein
MIPGEASILRHPAKRVSPMRKSVHARLLLCRRAARLKCMEVHLTPELEEKLNELATQSRYRLNGGPTPHQQPGYEEYEEDNE